MLFSFLFRLMIVIIVVKSIITNINTYKMLDKPILTFKYSNANKIFSIALSLLLLVLGIDYLFNTDLSIIVVMNSIIAAVFCIYLLFLSLIENKITDKGISLNNFGVYLWKNIESVEYNNNHMIIYYKVKVPIIKPIKSFHVKIPSENADEILAAVEENLNRKAYTEKAD